MFKDIKKELSGEVDKFARKSLIKKLKKQGLDYTELASSEFESLVADERAILEADTKKVGAGIGIGIAISLLTGI